MFDVLYLMAKILMIALLLVLSGMVLYFSIKSSSIKKELEEIEAECTEQKIEILAKPFMVSNIFNHSSGFSLDLISQIKPFAQAKSVLDLFRILKQLRTK